MPPRSLVPSPLLATAMAGASGFQELSNEPIERILRTAREQLGVEIAFVSRYVEGDQRELTHVDTSLDLPMGAGFREPREASYCWHILHGRLPELIQDPADHPFTRDLAITSFLPVGCHLNVPLRLSDGTVYGSFCCLSRQPDRSMNKRDMGVVRAFAALAVEQIETSLEQEMSLSTRRERVDSFLRHGSITVLHQPIVSLADGSPTGVESLARFPDAHERGPDAWFNEAASVGLGVPLELMAIETALATRSQLPSGFYLSVNASPEAVMSGELARLLDGQHGSNIVLEVTEHQQVADYDALAASLAELPDTVRIAIDDVGAGYAGMRHIVDLQPDLLKIDMSLTRNIHRDPARRALTKALVHFGADIGCKLVAEGIETAEEMEALAELGVDFGQGWHFARPMPVVAALQYLIGNGEAQDIDPAPTDTEPATRTATGPAGTRRRA